MLRKNNPSRDASKRERRQDQTVGHPNLEHHDRSAISVAPLGQNDGSGVATTVMARLN